MLQHGAFQVTIEENILIATFVGAWNRQQTLHYYHYVKTHALCLASAPWARIVDLSNWEGGGEEIIEPLYQTNNWCIENNCKLVVFVNPPLVPKYMLEKYGDPYGGYEIFEDIQSAKTHVIDKLAKLTS